MQTNQLETQPTNRSREAKVLDIGGTGVLVKGSNENPNQIDRRKDCTDQWIPTAVQKGDTTGQR
jgi:hypothetical protein